MNHRLLFSGLAILIMSLSSCDVLALPEELPTLIPEEYVPTAIALTAQALAENAPTPETSPTAPSTVIPTFTLEPTSTESVPTPTVPSPTPGSDSPQVSPTFTAFPADVLPASTPEITLPSRIPYGAIQILSPGPLSKISSLIQLNAYVSPGDKNKVWVALFGEDGRLLLRDTFTVFTTGNYSAPLKEDLEFAIQGAAETARLEITTYDEFGRVIALATQNLVLIATGDSDINLPRDLYEGIVIQQPSPSRLIQGGKLVVAGITRHAPGDVLRVEVVDVNGKTLASQVIGVSEKQLGEGYRPYAGEILYNIEKPVWVRVLVSAWDGRMSDVVHVSSVVVLLAP